MKCSTSNPPSALCFAITDFWSLCCLFFHINSRKVLLMSLLVWSVTDRDKVGQTKPVRDPLLWTIKPVQIIESSRWSQLLKRDLVFFHLWEELRCWRTIWFFTPKYLTWSFTGIFSTDWSFELHRDNISHLFKLIIINQAFLYLFCSSVSLSARSKNKVLFEVGELYPYTLHI